MCFHRHRWSFVCEGSNSKEASLTGFKELGRRVSFGHSQADFASKIADNTLPFMS